MSENPFHNTLDTVLRGKRVRVATDAGTFVGWVERVNHSRGSVVLFDAENEDTGEELGAVYVRNPNVVVALTPSKRIEYRRLDELEPHHEYPGGVTPDDDVVRACRRAGYAGSFPVVRTDGTILNGHKRVRAAEVAGLEHHPVEVVDVTDEQARELFAIAHRELAVDAKPNALEGLTFVFTGELSPRPRDGGDRRREPRRRDWRESHRGDGLPCRRGQRRRAHGNGRAPGHPDPRRTGVSFAVERARGQLPTVTPPGGSVTVLSCARA